MISEKTFFEINDGSGSIGNKGRYSFETQAEAIAIAKAFKADPRINNPKMTDDSVAYWKGLTYTIIKKTVTTETLGTV